MNTNDINDINDINDFKNDSQRVCYVIDRDYDYNLIREKNKRLSSQHGIIKFLLKMTYFSNREGGFKFAYKAAKEAGWTVNYDKSELEAIYLDLIANAYYINANDVDLNKHSVAKL